MSTKRAWVTMDGDYIGVTGADTTEQMAGIIASDPDVADALAGDGETLDAPSAIVHALDRLGVHPVIIPTAHLHAERWDGSHVYPCGIGDRPGRGRVKVLGVHL